MKKEQFSFCKSTSDKDFIFDIFSTNGFLPNASIFLKSETSNDFKTEDLDNDEIVVSETNK